MRIVDLMYYFIDADFQKIELYDLNSDKTVFEGHYGDMPAKYEDMEIASIDNMYPKTDTLTINIAL